MFPVPRTYHPRERCGNLQLKSRATDTAPNPPLYSPFQGAGTALQLGLVASFQVTKLQGFKASVMQFCNKSQLRQFWFLGFSHDILQSEQPVCHNHTNALEEHTNIPGRHLFQFSILAWYQCLFW